MGDDDMSTPLSHLGGNQRDDSQIANKILDKYNSMIDVNRQEQGQMAQQLMPRPQSSNEIMELPPLDRDQLAMEERFENRDLNQDMYQLNARDPIMVERFNQELKKSKDYIRNQAPVDQNEEYDEYDEEYDYVDEEPLWRRWLNEARIILFIIIFVTLFFNINFGVDKYLCRYSFFGNENYDCNWKGVLFKSILVGIFSYMAIRFIRV